MNLKLEDSIVQYDINQHIISITIIDST